jgi:hypothetical protein
LVTSCALTGVAASHTPEINAATTRNCDFIESLLQRKLPSPMNQSFSQKSIEAHDFHVLVAEAAASGI